MMDGGDILTAYTGTVSIVLGILYVFWSIGSSMGQLVQCSDDEQTVEIAKA